MNLIEKIDLKERVYGGVDGAVQLLVAQQAAVHGKLVYIARDDARMAQMQQGLAALDPEVNIQILPAWDCLPYDRVSPHAGIISQRIQTLSHLYGMADRIASPCAPAKNSVLLTTINSWMRVVKWRKKPSPIFLLETVSCAHKLFANLASSPFVAAF